MALYAGAGVVDTSSSHDSSLAIQFVVHLCDSFGFGADATANLFLMDLLPSVADVRFKLNMINLFLMDLLPMAAALRFKIEKINFSPVSS